MSVNPDELPKVATISPTLPDAKETKPSRSSRRETWRSIITTVLILIAAPVIALTITNYVFQSYQVDGASMQSTLHNGDRLIVLKWPVTWGNVKHKPYQPKRTDIIVFNKNDFSPTPANTSGKQLIKRVIGLPGEHVVVKDNTVTVYNSEHPEGFNPDKTYPYGSVIKDTPQPTDVVVPDGEIFVMGDNRGDSLDSRYFGPIQLSTVVGRASLRILPVGQIHRL